MSPSLPWVKRVLYWTPRVLCTLFAGFVSLFALDVFAEHRGAADTAAALMIHLVPTFIVVAVLVIAWRSEGLGGLLFVALGVWYVSECWGRFPRGTLAVIGGPPMFIGLLFLLDWAYRARFGYRD